MGNETLSKGTEYLDQMILDRRHFHKYPELSYQEFKTAEYICDRLKQLEISYQYPVGDNGIIAWIDGEKPGQTLAFRADMDALKIQETNQIGYRSVHDGIMHACGHDFHMAALLGFAASMKKEQPSLAGRIVLIFQYAEETGPGGAVVMAEHAAISQADKIYGAHVDTAINTGFVAVRDGVTSGTSQAFRVKIQGKGGHSSAPLGTVDALLTACQCVTSLHTIIGRNLNPFDAAAVNVGYLRSGAARNVICDDAYFGGLLRAQESSVCDALTARMEEIISGICCSNGAGYELETSRGYPCVVNSARETAMVRSGISRFTNCRLTEAGESLGGEDFAYFLHKRPGCMFYAGARNEEKGFVHPGHHPDFNGDEQCMAVILDSFWAIYQSEQEDYNIYDQQKGGTCNGI